ncbi:MAG: hypothetical protein RCG15_07525 [Candidatus Rickettsia vulgarisii]
MAVGQKKEKFEAKIQEIKNLENSEERYNKINPEKDKFANQLVKDMLNRSKPRSL